jgi:hypothetical protein
MSQLTVEGDSFLCPNCGAEVRKGKASCPECGSCDETGWSDAATEGYADGGYDGDDDFDYDEFVQREFPGESDSISTKQWGTTLLIVLICLGMTLAVVFSR